MKQKYKLVNVSINILFNLEIYKYVHVCLAWFWEEDRVHWHWGQMFLKDRLSEQNSQNAHILYMRS